MGNILHQLFLNNESITEQIYAFCRTLPEFVQVEREYHEACQRVLQALDRELYHQWEMAVFRYTDIEVNAHYLFGLGVRQELLQAILQDNPSAC